MTNKEYWTGKVADEVLTENSLAVVDNMPQQCDITPCGDCAFKHNCTYEAARHWLNAEAPMPTRLEWLHYANAEEVAKIIYKNDGFMEHICKYKPECDEGCTAEDCIKCAVEWLNELIQCE